MSLLTGNTYTLEVWTSSGTLLADISRLAQARHFVLTRNDAELFNFNLELSAFEAYCASINVNPLTLLVPYQTDIKLKRNGVYLFGTQIVGIDFNFTPNDTGVNTETGAYMKSTTLTETVTVTCTGYLNLFTDRYITNTYTNFDTGLAASDLINWAQSQPNGSVGATIAPGQYSTGVMLNTTLTRQNIKTQLQALSTFVGGLYDFAFDYRKYFYTAAMMGSKRGDIAIIYGGSGSNVIGLYHTRSASGTLYNQIIGLGSGVGYDGITSIQDNQTSEGANYLRQDIKTYSDVTDQPTLNQRVAADLALESSLLEIPQIMISGKELIGLPFLVPGDRVPLYFPTHPFLANLSGNYYRIEQLDVKLDDNDFEYEIGITFDNYGLY